MASTFQPEKPHGTAKPGTGKLSIFVWALISALGVMMILALLTPRWFDVEGARWAVSLGAAALTFFLVYGTGMQRSSRPEQTADTSASRSAHL